VLALAAADEPELMADVEIDDTRLEAAYLALAKSRDEPKLETEGTRHRVRPSREHVWQGIAASLLVGLVIALWWGLSLQRNLRLAEAPRVNVHILDLVPLGEGEERRSVDEATIPADMPAALIILNVEDYDEHSSYELEIHSATAQSTRPRVISGLSRSEEGNFTLELLQAELPDGRYLMTLFGVTDGQRKVIAEYAAEIAYQENGGERPGQ
jgi:hypothetical protein